MVTLEEKYKCVLRELALRRAVYPKQVERKRMKEYTAFREIEIMEAIVADYALLVHPEQGK